MTSATVSSKSQITLPAAACRATGIRPHGRVIVEVREGAIIVRPAPDLMDLKGLVGRALPRGVEIKSAMRAVAARQKKAS